MADTNNNTDDYQVLQELLRIVQQPMKDEEKLMHLDNLFLQKNLNSVVLEDSVSSAKL